MVESKYKEKTCVFCGKVREFRVVSDDGVDWLGHARGKSDYQEFDDGCDCVLGIIEKSKAEIKPMCLNCKSYDYGSCTNEKELEKISRKFDVGSSVYVKRPTLKCDNWEFNSKVLEKIVAKRFIE